jgi:hypothetical protein
VALPVANTYSLFPMTKNCGKSDPDISRSFGKKTEIANEVERIFHLLQKISISQVSRNGLGQEKKIRECLSDYAISDRTVRNTGPRMSIFFFIPVMYRSAWSPIAMLMSGAVRAIFT